MTEERSLLSRSPFEGVVKLSIVSAIFVDVVAAAAAQVVTPTGQPPENLFLNGGVIGFGVFSIYGWIFNRGNQTVVRNIVQLFRRVRAGDQEAAKRVAYLSIAANVDTSEDMIVGVISHALQWRARVYFGFAWILYVAIGAWVAGETFRQAGKLVWDWSAVSWTWP